MTRLDGHAEAGGDPGLGPTEAEVSWVPTGFGPQAYDPVRHATPRAALQWVLSQFDTHLTAVSARLWASDNPHDNAVLYRADDMAGHRAAVVIGDDEMAVVLRGLFPCDQWRLRITPIPGTPLTTLQPSLGTRIYSTLTREGFITVEEVAAVSDRALIDIRGIGPGSINTIRDALAAARTPSWPEDTLVTLSGPQVRELTSLLATLTVYAEACGKSDVVRRAHAFIADALSRPPNA